MVGSMTRFFSALFTLTLAHSALARSCEFKDAEIKVPVSTADANKILKEWNLLKKTPKDTVIYFFDSKSLDLSQNGWILRQRHSLGEKIETTLKSRLQEKTRLKGISKLDLSKGEEIKCEVDASMVSQSYSVSLTGFNSDSVSTPTLNTSQKKLLKKNFNSKVGDLLALGPIYSKKWSYKNENGLVIDFEIWQISENHYFAETSLKVSAKDIKDAKRDLIKSLQKIGVTPAELQETKTAFAFEYFSNNP